MKTTIKTSAPYLINQFKNFARTKHNPYNRCDATTIEEGLEQGYSIKECLESISIHKILDRSYKTYGYIPLNVITLFESEDGVFYSINGGHNIEYLKKLQREEGITYPINVIVFPEDKSIGFNLENASQLMRAMNQDGATKWSFLDIIRTFNTPRAKAVMDLFGKFGKDISSIAVIADVVSDTTTSTKRDSIDRIWNDSKLGVWADSFEYLSTLTSVKISKSISQPASDAFKVLWTLAKECRVLDTFKRAITSVELPIKFGNCGRPTKNLWLHLFVKSLNCYRGEMTSYEKKKYRNFVTMAESKVDYAEIANNMINNVA